MWEGEHVTDGPNETIPERLLTLVRLDAEQPVQQPVMEFSPDRWVERAPDHADVFAELPGLLDRASVRGFCDQRSYDDVGATGVFIASQVWGYGRVGYGPFRLGEALADPRLAAVLSSTRALLRDGRTTDAFRELCVAHELPRVGTAFGTKFLHFADPTGSALILDSVVAGWLRQHTGIRLRCLRDEREYVTWLALATSWAAEAGTTPERIELLLFSDGLPEGSQWA